MLLEMTQSQEDSLDPESATLPAPPLEPFAVPKRTLTTPEPEGSTKKGHAFVATRRAFSRPPSPPCQPEEATQAYESHTGPWQGASGSAGSNPQPPPTPNIQGPDSPLKPIP